MSKQKFFNKASDNKILEFGRFCDWADPNTN